MGTLIHLDYNTVTDCRDRINSIIKDVNQTLENISSLYSKINTSELYEGTSAASYQDTFNRLKQTAFVKVPECTAEFNRILATVVGDGFVETENRISAAAQGK